MWIASRTGSLPRKRTRRWKRRPRLWRGAGLLDPAHRLDEIDGVVVVLLDAGGDGEDVGIEDDVLGRESRSTGQQFVGAAQISTLRSIGVGLALLVEGHDDHAAP